MGKIASGFVIASEAKHPPRCGYYQRWRLLRHFVPRNDTNQTRHVVGRPPRASGDCFVTLFLAMTRTRRVTSSAAPGGQSSFRWGGDDQAVGVGLGLGLGLGIRVGMAVGVNVGVGVGVGV